ncbi:MAG TPA: hypothetical protein VFW71_05860 [Actinomycetota bacterium]|nr:hypothetical protein [Actinomycetota bacterium]
MSDAIDALADGFRRAYADGDRELLASLLDPGVTWGEPGAEGGCSNRKQVLAWFDNLGRIGMRGTVTGVEQQADGFVLVVEVDTPQGIFTVRQRMTVAGDLVISINPDGA